MKRQLRNATTPLGPRCRAALLGALLAAPGVAAAASAAELDALEAAVRGACEGEAAQGPAAASAGGARLLEQSPLVVRGREVGWRRRLAAQGGGRIVVEGIAPGGKLRRVRAEYQELAAQGLRPLAMALADGRCRIRTGRRLVYAPDGRAEAIERLDTALEEVLVREPLDAAVPPAPGHDGVIVAMVDAGVNYLLPRIRDRLARDASGELVGYDYWDLDPRPFDAHPARSPFFPQRHGTQTASLLLEEAPVAALAPFRYPRPDMSRMEALVANAAGHGVVVMNLSLGGNRREEWIAFERSARAHPEMLFVVSAGNNGRDIDSHPVYPASLDLANMLTITSAEADGQIAPGSNWGRRSVDLLVPAEEMLVADFHGRPRVVSGASYAAVRVSALAACLLAANPQWTAQELRAEILSRAEVAEDDVERRSAHGFLADPTAGERGACAPSRSELARLSSTVWTGGDLGGAAPRAAAGITHELTPTFVVFDDAGWQLESVRAGAARARSILAQCGVDIPRVAVVVMDGPKRFKIFREDWATELVTEEQFARPAVFFVRDTLQEIAFDAEAIGRSNARGRPALRDTVWMTSAVEHVGVSLAHELYHVVADGGAHDPDAANLMHERTAGENTALRAGQCLRLVTVGESLGTLRRVGE